MVIFITNLPFPDDGVGCYVYAVNSEHYDYPWTPRLLKTSGANIYDDKDIEFIFGDSSIFVDAADIKQIEIYK